MNHWTNNAIFYAIYPLGFCGCEENQTHQVNHRINKLIDWIPHLKSLHIQAIYLGPVFYSSKHGYDTIDYFQIDPRLGNHEDFKQVCDALHEANIHIVLDGVFNHVGRDFWAFKDVLEKKWDSPYKDWFVNVDFSRSSCFGDPFYYEGWENHYELVKLNLYNPEVCNHLLNAINMWIDEYHLDGLRLDAANCIPSNFFKQLKEFTKYKKEDFWLMAEVIHGDYNQWVNPEMLDSVTNYECYKGIYSSHNSKNYFEIAYAFNRQHGDYGIYKNIQFYNFVDNHDVNRISSSLTNPKDLKNVYTMLYTMCGIPSIYYGSEWGIKGTRDAHNDTQLRPELNLCDIQENELLAHIQKLGEIKTNEDSFHDLHYKQIYLTNEQYIYQRNELLIAFNCSDERKELPFQQGTYIDLFTDKEVNSNGTIKLDGHDCMILKMQEH